jgi:hypothetical protein
MTAFFCCLFSVVLGWFQGICVNNLGRAEFLQKHIDTYTALGNNRATSDSYLVLSGRSQEEGLRLYYQLYLFRGIMNGG